MTFPRRPRYKDAKPTETVRRIRNVLKRVGVITEVEFYEHSKCCFSCRLRIVNERIGPFDVGVNGKGVTKQYALASAYGELMERIQNKALFRDGLRYSVRGDVGCWRNDGLPLLAHLFAPDERLVKITSDACPRFLKNWFPLACDHVAVAKLPVETIMLPFEQLGTSRNELLPVELIREVCGTTGMCAGNTKTEAITQGLYEIQERYVLQQIYIGAPRLPDVDLTLFKQTKVGRDILADAKRRGIEYRVKDCSLDGKFPVLGLLIVDKKKGVVSFRLGADYNIITALERCYTETYQGGSVSCNVFRSPLLGEDPTTVDYRKSCENGTGAWPGYLLDVVVSSNRFPHRETRSSKEVYELTVKNLVALGYRIYCRDNSFLGFPAYHLYVPGLSDVHSRLNDINESVRNRTELRRCIPFLWRIPRLTKRELKQLAASLSNADVTIKLFPWLNGKAGSRYSRLLQSACALVVGNEKMALQALLHLKKDLALFGSTMPLYYEAYISCLKLRLEGGYFTNRERLVSLYGEELIGEIEDEIKSPSAGFMSSLPNCFECTKCKMSDKCGYSTIVKLESRIQVAQRSGR